MKPPSNQQVEQQRAPGVGHGTTQPSSFPPGTQPHRVLPTTMRNNMLASDKIELQRLKTCASQRKPWFLSSWRSSLRHNTQSLGVSLPSSLPNLVNDKGSVIIAYVQNTGVSECDENTAIQQIQDLQRDHFDRLDELLADMTDKILLPIFKFLRLHFWLKHNHIEYLPTYPVFNSLNSFLVYSDLSVEYFVATIGNSYIQHPDLAMILLFVWICGAVLYSYL